MANQIIFGGNITPATTPMEVSINGGTSFSALTFATINSAQQGTLGGVPAATYAAGQLIFRCVGYPATAQTNTVPLTIAQAVTAASTEIFKNSMFTVAETGNRATGWEATAGNPLSNISNGGLNVNGNTDTVQTVAMVVGTRYKLTATLRSCSVGSILILTNSGGNGQIGSGLSANVLTGSVTFTASSSSELYYVRGAGGTDAIVSLMSLTPA